SMLQSVGIQNVSSKMKRYPEIDDEKILHSNADLLLLSSEPFPFREKHRNEFQKRFPELQVYLIYGEMCS
ncbi:MAG: cobalamin-binding protein, partial [SAR324 cluster bacterium]|nr:cobalamin-binding protein [SAR324 cluster bacterium]